MESNKRRTVELTRARASDNFEHKKLVEKHAIAPRVQRIVRRLAQRVYLRSDLLSDAQTHPLSTSAISEIAKSRSDSDWINRLPILHMASPPMMTLRIRLASLRTSTTRTAP